MNTGNHMIDGITDAAFDRAITGEDEPDVAPDYDLAHDEQNDEETELEWLVRKNSEYRDRILRDMGVE